MCNPKVTTVLIYVPSFRHASDNTAKDLDEAVGRSGRASDEQPSAPGKLRKVVAFSGFSEPPNSTAWAR